MKTPDTKWKNSCVVLTRVSTNEQDYTSQETDLINWANRLGYTNIKTISTKESGFKTFDKKEGFRKVIQFINEYPQYDTIVITELSRLSRRKKVLFRIKEWLEDNKIQLRVKDISFNLFDENGGVSLASDMTFTMFASIAESEMETKKIRFKRALTELRKNGYSIGGKQLFGYNRTYDKEMKRNTYEVNNTQANEIRTIYNWYLNGIDDEKTKCSIRNITLKCIANNFSSYLHNKRNVTKCLGEQAYISFKITKNKRKNPEYWIFQDITAPKYIHCSTELKYPRILSDELFMAVQKKKKERNTQSDKSNKHITILSKLIKCPSCGRYLGGDYRKNNGVLKHNYRCSKRNTINNCNHKTMYSMVQLDSAIWAFIKDNMVELIESMQNYYNNLNVNKVYNEINESKNKISSLIKEKYNESKIYRTLTRDNDSPVFYEEFQNKIASIDLLINDLKSFIIDQENVIIEVEKKRNINYHTEIREQIEEIEHNKNLLYKYIHLLIETIIPIYSDRKYTVLEIYSINNVGNNLIDFSNSVDEIKAVIKYFLLIDKHDSNRIKLRIIDNSSIFFQNGSFIYNGMSTNINELFELPIINTLEPPFLMGDKKIIKYLSKKSISTQMRELEYNRLNVYEND